VRSLNRFVEDRAPWVLAKDPDRAGELDRVLYTLCDGVRVISIMLASVMPDAARRAAEAVGASDSVAWSGVTPGGLPAGAVTRPGQPMFPRVDEPLA